MDRQFELIVSIVGRGFSDLVMDAARKAGASGAPSFTGAAQACMRRRSSLASPSSPKRSWC